MQDTKCNIMYNVHSCKDYVQRFRRAVSRNATGDDHPFVGYSRSRSLSTLT